MISIIAIVSRIIIAQHLLNECRRDILCTARVSGSTAQSHLNKLGIGTSLNSEHKGLLIHTDIDDAIANATDPIFRNTLEEIKKRGL